MPRRAPSTPRGSETHGEHPMRIASSPLNG